MPGTLVHHRHRNNQGQTASGYPGNREDLYGETRGSTLVRGAGVRGAGTTTLALHGSRRWDRYGSLALRTFSSEDTIENPRYFRTSEKKLATAQQSLARKKRGGTRRKDAVKRVGTCHRKVRRQRQDFHHKQSRMLVDCYETIVFENLKPATMSRRPKPKQDSDGTYLPNGAAGKGGLNKSIQDAGWSRFIGMVRAKAEGAGHTTVLLVNPKDTSQICSGCLKKGPHKDLDERTHTCVHCGLVLDRDVNAAHNILRLGLSHQATNVS